MTMIHINLLPVRQVKKRELGRQWLVLGGLLIILSGLLNYFWWSARQGEADRNAVRIAQTQRKVTELDKVLSDVSAINKRRTEVTNKLKQLDDLRKGRSGPVRMMDALSVATPKKVWLNEFDEKQEAVDVKGTAVSNEDVAEFMRSLNGVVWTPQGIGRLVEQRKDGKTSRVELLTGDGSVQEFAQGDVKHFFTNVDLKSSQSSTTVGAAADRLVDFEITFSAHYAI